jgi:hypothetical protein
VREYIDRPAAAARAAAEAAVFACAPLAPPGRHVLVGYSDPGILAEQLSTLAIVSPPASHTGPRRVPAALAAVGYIQALQITSEGDMAHARKAADRARGGPAAAGADEDEGEDEVGGPGSLPAADEDGAPAPAAAAAAAAQAAGARARQLPKPPCSPAAAARARADAFLRPTGTGTTTHRQSLTVGRAWCLLHWRLRWWPETTQQLTQQRGRPAGLGSTRAGSSSA